MPIEFKIAVVLIALIGPVTGYMVGYQAGAKKTHQKIMTALGVRKGYRISGVSFVKE